MLDAGGAGRAGRMVPYGTKTWTLYSSSQAARPSERVTKLEVGTAAQIATGPKKAKGRQAFGKVWCLVIFFS